MRDSDRKNSKKLNQHQRVQDQKIFRHCLGQKDSNSINPDDVVFNFSTRLISDKEKEILSKGLNFAIPPIKLNFCSFLTPFEKFYHQLKQEPVNINSGVFFPESIKAKLKDIAYSGFRSYSRPNALYLQEQLNILKDLRNDSNIVIMKPDKGNGVVILNKHDYNKKMEEILSDTSKLELLNDDAIKIILKRENRLKTLKKLKADNCFNERTYNELYPTGTRIGTLYGLPKIHKFSIPQRPILSSINHYSYKIAKFFIPFLTPISSNQLSRY